MNDITVKQLWSHYIFFHQIQGTEKEGEIHEALRDGTKRVQQWCL